MKTVTHYDDSLLSSLDANVVDVLEENNNYWITLDETIFYPEGGGMNRDKGTINGIEVLDLKEKEGVIYHLLSEKVSGKVHLEIDAEDRLRRMQCHTSQHLVAAIFINEYKMECVSNSFISDGTCDLIMKGREITPEILKDVEKKANEFINQDIAVTVEYISREDAKKFTDDFSYYENLELYRLVSISNYDKELCGCPHVPSTRYIKGINLTSIHKVKDGYQVIISCGNHLIEKAHEYYDEIAKVSNLLACKNNQIVESTISLIESYKHINNRLNYYKSKYLELYSEEKIKSLDLSKINVILESHDDLEIKDLQYLVSKFSSLNKVIIIGILKKLDGTSNLMIAKNKDIENFSARNIFATIAKDYGYRGGGNDAIAQGGGKYFENMEEIILELINKSLK